MPEYEVKCPCCGGELKDAKGTEFDVRKVDNSHSRAVFFFASTTQAQTWLKVFPNPMPETHALSYCWVASPNPKAPSSLVIEPLPVGSKPTIEQPAPVQAKPEKLPPPAELVAEIEALDPSSSPDYPNIVTKAAMIGVSVFLNNKAGKRCTRAQLVARMARKLAEQREAVAA